MKIYCVFSCYAEGDGWNAYELENIHDSYEKALGFVTKSEKPLSEYTSREECDTAPCGEFECSRARFECVKNENYPYLIEEVEVV